MGGRLKLEIFENPHSLADEPQSEKAVPAGVGGTTSRWGTSQWLPPSSPLICSFRQSCLQAYTELWPLRTSF